MLETSIERNCLPLQTGKVCYSIHLQSGSQIKVEIEERKMPSFTETTPLQNDCEVLLQSMKAERSRSIACDVVCSRDCKTELLEVQRESEPKIEQFEVYL